MILSVYPETALSEQVVLMHQGINTAADKVQYADVGTPIIQSKHFTSGALDLEDTKFLGDKDTEKYREKTGIY